MVHSVESRGAKIVDRITHKITFISQKPPKTCRRLTLKAHELFIQYLNKVELCAERATQCKTKPKIM